MSEPDDEPAVRKGQAENTPGPVDSVIGAEQPAVAIVARGIRVNGPWGPVYGPVDLDIDEGGVTVLLCEASSGRIMQRNQ